MPQPWEMAALEQGAAPVSGNPWDAVYPTEIDQSKANTIGKNIWLGLQESSAGLALRRELPSMQAVEDAPWYHRVARMAGGVVGDVPAMIGGAVGGAAAGAAVTGPGAPIGASVGGVAGSFAAPMAIREALIDAYSNNYATSWEGVWNIALSALKGGAKGAAIGAATAGAGRFVSGAIAPTVGVGTRAAATAGAELVALTTTASALEGHLPTAQDFMDNAILLVGIKASVKAAGALRNTFKDTGKHPMEVSSDAQVDPTIKKDLEAGKVPEVYKPIVTEEMVKAALDRDVRPEVLRDMVASDKGPIDLSKPMRGDPVRMEYIVGPAEYKGVLRDMTALYEPEIQAQRRGVVSNVQTLAEMRAMLGADAIQPTKPGQAANAAEMSARLALLRSSTQDAYAAIKEHAALKPEQVSVEAKLKVLASIERMKAFHQEVSGVAAEWGRAGQMMRQLKHDPTVLDSANTLLKAVERKGDLSDIAKLAESLKDPAQLTKFSNEYLKATTTEQVIEGWKAAILSGPQTHQANIMGNVAKGMLEVPESVLRATFYAVDRAAKGDPLKFSQWKARAMSPINGVMMGGLDGLKTAAEIMRTGSSIYDKFDTPRGAIPGKIGEFVRLPFRFLQAQDAIFRVPAERAQTYIMAVDRAVKEGIHPETAEGRSLVQSYVKEPTRGMTPDAAGKALAAIKLAGDEAVFSQPLGPRMSTFQASIAGSWMGFIFPFVRTPVNLLSWAVQHTPGINLLSGRWRSDFMAGGEQRASAIARVVVGTGISALAYSLSEQGILTGGGMFDKEEGNAKRAAGRQPYSIKIGDKYYSFQRLEPVSKILGLAADIIELQTKGEKLSEEDKYKLTYMMVAMFGNATVSTTYLSGLNSVMQSVTDPERYADNFIEQYASSVVPKIIGQPAAMIDPYKREVDGVIQAIQSQLPYFREQLMPKRDVWGEKTLNERLLNVTPIAMTQASVNKVKTEAMRLELALTNVPKYIIEPGPTKQRERKVRLDETQVDVLKAVSGARAMEILAPLVNSREWDDIPDIAKVKIFKDVISDSRKEAKDKTLPPDVAARQRIRDRMLDSIQKDIERTQQRQSIKFDANGNSAAEQALSGSGGSRIRFDPNGNIGADAAMAGVLSQIGAANNSGRVVRFDGRGEIK